MAMGMEEVVTDMEDHTTEEVVMGIKATNKDIKDIREDLDTLSFLTLMDTKPDHIVMDMGIQATAVIMATIMGATTEDAAMDIIITTVRNLRNTFTFIAITGLQEQQEQQLVQQQQQAQLQEQPIIRPIRRLFISVAAGKSAADTMATDIMASDIMASDTDITVAITAVDTVAVLTTLLLSRI